jgi:outer membrane cobalamin receptor
MARRTFPLFRPVLLALCGALVSVSAFADTLAGRVVDPHGRPVASAEVLVVRDGAVVATVTTTGDGRFGPVTLPSGEYDLLASTRGLRAESRRITLGAQTPVDLEIALAPSAIKESVVVSASQVDTPLTRVTDSVTVIDRVELDVRQTATVADALRLVPGFGIVASGTLGGVTSIFPRGGASNYTLVLVDGIPQNAFGGNFDAAHLNTADIDRIEVVRGPESALFGVGAIGGVVQIVTRQSGPLGGGVTFERGGYDTQRANASATGSRGAWRWGGAFDQLKTAGDTRVVPSIGGRVSNDDYTRDAGSASLGWSDRPSRSIRIDLRAGRNERGNPGPYGSDPLGLYGGLDTVSRGTNRTQEIGASAVFGSGNPWRQRLQVTWANLQGHFVYPSFDPTTPIGTSDDATRRATGRYQIDVRIASVGLSAGSEFMHERATNTFITGKASEPVPITRAVAGWFLEARPSFGDRVFLTVGARVERIERTALEGDAFGARPTFGNDVVWSPNPKVSAAWWLSKSVRNWTRIRGSAGTGIRPPNAFELAFTNNPSLKPERNKSGDLGVEHALGGGAVVVDATVFVNRYNDLIVTVGRALTGASRYSTDNIANAASRGLEGGVAWSGGHGLSARAAWTWLHTEVLSVDHLPHVSPTSYYAVGDPLVRRPRQQGSVELDWSSGRGTAFVSVNGRGKVADLEPNFAAKIFTNPGYAVVALGGSVRLTREFELFGRVDNLFNRAFEEVLGFPAFGRSASVGVRIAASR